MNTPRDYFEQMFQHSDDPWAFDRRWYEQRKRDLTLACLPHQRYGRAFEPGCANGVLSQALAERCDALLAMDFSHRAVELARQRLAPLPQVEVRHGQLPADWPATEFDLIVLSEVGYYLDPAAWRSVAERARDSLAAGGVLLACHWLQPIDGAPQTGQQVHQCLRQCVDLHRVVRHEDAGFLLELWCRTPAAVDLDEAVNSQYQ